MRFNIFAAFAIFCGLFLTACGSGKPEEQIVGKWKVDLSALANDPKLAEIKDEAKKKEMLDQVTKMMGSMTAEFTKDGKMSMVMGKDMKTEGTYTVKSSEGNVLTLETKMKRGDKEKTETVKVTMDGGKMKLAGPGGQEIVFTK